MNNSKERNLVVHVDNMNTATGEAMAMRKSGVFPFVVIGGNEELKKQVFEVAEHIGKQITIGYVIVPDIDSEERHIVVKNIGKDGNACVTVGYNGSLDTFRQSLKESISQAYSGDCAP